MTRTTLFSSFTRQVVVCLALHASYCTAFSNFTQGIHPVTHSFLAQWRNPQDILSLLLIIGGDVVQKALAQLSGGYFVPVTFSFGWVAYSFSALMTVFGDGRIMPNPECSSIVVNSSNGYVRANHSWVLSRLLRDFEEPCDWALRVVVFEAKPDPVSRDWIWYSGTATMMVQFVLAAIPFVCQGNWVILMVTIVGTVLALCDGALPQWRSEKWSGRLESRKTVSLTRGNGSQHIMVIISKGKTIDLEDLASSRVEILHHTRSFLTIFAFLRLVLLVTVSGLKQDAWYLMAIGALGMVQNVIAAAAVRSPAAHGLQLEQIEEFKGGKVMKVLQELEEYKAGVGASLVRVFFPGDLQENEKAWWDARKAGRDLVPTPMRRVSRTHSIRIVDSNTRRVVVWRRRR